MCRCNWYKVYDFLEAIHSRMTPGEQTHFEAAINACSLERGVGWKLVDGQVVMRGTEAFETVVRKRSAPWRKRTDRRQQAMFTRPCWLSLDVPRLTQPAQFTTRWERWRPWHANLTGNPRETLGEIIRRNPDLLPRPLNYGTFAALGLRLDLCAPGRGHTGGGAASTLGDVR